MVPQSKHIRKRVRYPFLLCRNFSRLAVAEHPCAQNGEEEEQEQEGKSQKHGRKVKLMPAEEYSAGIFPFDSTHSAGEHCTSKLTHGKNKKGGAQERSVLALYEELSYLETQNHTKPSIAGLTHMLHMCRREKNLSLALRVHNLICDMGLEAHAHLADPLVSMLAEVGSMRHAQHVFDMLECKSESSWNTIIIGFAKFGELGHACILYEQMQSDASLYAGSCTVVALLNACGRLKDVERGCRLHADIARRGLLDRDVYVGSTLVDM
eukprot:c19325_g4_i1 orf=125-922(+)